MLAPYLALRRLSLPLPRKINPQKAVESAPLRQNHLPPHHGERICDILGILQYAAPEYFTGEFDNSRSDYFSPGVLAHQMLTGRPPYGTQVAKLRTIAQQKNLMYVSACSQTGNAPEWIDFVLKGSAYPDPIKNYHFPSLRTNYENQAKHFNPGDIFL